MTWLNSDGLLVKFGKEEADLSPGGTVQKGDRHEIVFEIDYTDALSATASVLGTVGTAGSMGVQVPKNFTPEALEILVKTAFTSSGTIGSSTLVIGTKKQSDFSTDLNADAFTTTAFVGDRLDAAGERTYVEVGATGAGDQYGIKTTENGVISVSNSAHATHPFTAGRAICRLYGFIPANV